MWASRHSSRGQLALALSLVLSQLSGCKRAPASVQPEEAAATASIPSVPPQSSPQPEAPAGATSSATPEADDEPDIDAGIRADGKSRYRVSRRSLAPYRQGSPATLRLARVIPVLNGKGVRVFAIRQGTLLDRLGLQNGDTIQQVNGKEPRNLDDLFNALATANSVEVVLSRDSAPLTIHYTVTP